MATSRTAVITSRGAELGLALVVVLVVGMMIVPLPTWALDLLLSTNLTLSVLLLLTALFVKRPLSFAAFPTVLLVTTLFRLGLNVSTTRLILSQADAGQVVRAFGDFVVAGNYVVGAVVFAIITLIQFVVVARGAERVAEVGARFTLDAMPGKQLSIDADLRAGVIDAEGARARRRELNRESQFYGAMDGAMKFVKGDAIAGLVIVVVNIVGGLAIGVGTRGMDASAALSLYGLLTIGDGLVAQIPALLISTAAGLVVTRVASEDEHGTLGSDIGKQILGDRRALYIAAGFALVLALVPGLPTFPFAVMALALAAGGYLNQRLRSRDAPSAPLVTPPRSEAMELTVGTGLARALDPEVLASHLEPIRERLYRELGVRLPPVHPEPSALLGADAYDLSLGAVRVDRGECPPGRRFREGDPETLQEDDPSVRLDGEGGWSALPGGREVTEVLAQRIERAARERPEDLVGIAETRHELDRLGARGRALVDHVVPSRLTVGRLAVLLRGLVAEGVSVRPLREILEAASLDPLPADDEGLLKIVRERLGRAITHDLLSDDGVLRVRLVDPEIEEAVRDARGRGVDPQLVEDVLAAVRSGMEDREGPVVLLTQPDVRRPLRRLLSAELPHLRILSYAELDPSVRLERLASVAPGP